MLILPAPGDQSQKGQILLETARSLEPVPKLVLEIVAVAGWPIPATDVAAVAAAVLPKQAKAAAVNEAVSQLVDSGHLERVADVLRCPKPLAEDLAIAALSQSSPKILARLRRDFPIRCGSWNRPDPLLLQGHFRWALFRGDDREIENLIRTCSLDLNPALAKVGAHISRPESFFDLSPRWGRRLAISTVIASLNTPFPADVATQALGRIIEADPRQGDLVTLYAHTLAMRGESDALNQLLSKHPRPELERYRDILEGDLSGEIPRTSSDLPGTMTLAFGVARIARDGEGPRVQYAAKGGEVEVMLAWLAKARHEGLPLARTTVADYLQSALSSRFHLLPHLALTLHWAGYSEEVRSLRPLEVAAGFRNAGYHTFATWLESIGGGQPSDSPYSRFVDILPPKERWEEALIALERWANPPAPQAPAVEERMIWEISPFHAYRTVQPKIQKMGKRGAWSQGRALRLDDAWRDPASCCDQYDLKVFDAIAAHQAKERGYSFGLNSEVANVALMALVGHPRVRLTAAPTEEVELVRGQPSLVIDRRQETYHLSLRPAMPGMAMVLAERDGPRRIVLYDLSQRMVALGAILGQGLSIPAHQREKLERLLSQISDAQFAIVSDLAPAVGNHTTVEPDPTLVLRLTPAGAGVSVQIRVAPLGEAGPLLSPGIGNPIVIGHDSQTGPVQTERSLQAELDALKALRQRAPELLGTDFEIPTAEGSLSLLESLHPPGDGVRVEWPEGRRFELTAKASTLDWQRMSEEAGWFELDAELRVSEQLVLSLTELLKRRAAANGRRFIKLDDGTYLALTTGLHRYLGRLERLSLGSAAHGLVRFSPLAALAALEGQEEEVQTDQGWQRLKKRALASTGTRARIPRDFGGELRPYQLEGYRWLSRLAHWGVGACLADDMGLGKTIQILVLLAARRDKGPALVVAPTSVGWNWKDEAARFAPRLNVHLLSEADRAALLDEVGAGDLVVCSYGLLVREADRLSEVRWDTVVLDEAQAIKNSQTKRARAAQALSADVRIAATGTPVENHLDELWSLFRWLNPGLLGSQRWFQTQFPAGDEEAQEDLAHLVRPFLLRRTKDQVLRDLPPRTDILLRVELSEAEASLYESLRRQAVERMSGNPEDYLGVLAELTRLRRACCHPRLVLPEWRLPGSKLETFRSLTDELMDNGHRALVFSQFVSHLTVLREDLDERGVGYQYLDGSTPAAARRQAVEAFQSGQDPLFLISLKAGGTGLNLTAADYVLHMDPWWNPAVEDQASDRAHRLGQQRPVTVYRLVARGTVEERIVALHEKKRDLAERLLAGTDSAAKLSTQELLALLV